MAAFNWVEKTIKCPVCSETTLVRAQVHVAASFDGNDEGRFCDLTYSIGDKLRWWDENHPRFNDWMLGGERIFEGTKTVRECCYASCSTNGDRLYMVVEVSDLLIRDILEVGREEEWPTEYLK